MTNAARSPFKFVVIVVLAVSAVSNTARAGRLGMPDKLRKEASGGTVTLIVTQEQLNKEIRPPQVGKLLGVLAVVPGVGLLDAMIVGGIAGGLDGAVIAERAMKADESLLPLRDALRGYEFDDKLTAELRDKLAAVEILQANAVALSKDQQAGLYDASMDSTRLNVFVTYRLSRDLSALSVLAEVQLMPRLPRPGEKQEINRRPTAKVLKPIYRNEVLYAARLPSTDNQSDADRINAWKAGKEILIASCLDEAISMVAQQLARDLSMSTKAVKREIADKSLPELRAPVVPRSETSRRPIALSESAKNGIFLGRVLEKTDRRQVLRMADGSVSIMVQL